MFDQNKYKAYEYILGHCSKVMKARIEEQANYEARVKNQPRVLLEEISKKMYDPARDKYEYMSLTQTFKRLLATKQEDEEGLLDYTKRFKQKKTIFQQ